MLDDRDAYRQALIDLYLHRPDTPRRLSRYDSRLVHQLWERQIPLTVIEERLAHPVPESYVAYLRGKVALRPAAAHSPATIG